MQRTASKAATDVLSVCHPPVNRVDRFTALMVAHLGLVMRPYRCKDLTQKKKSDEFQ
jgi:hypothetical protein